MDWSGQPHFTSFYNLPDEIGRAGCEGAALNKAVQLAVIGVEGLPSNEEISNQGQDKKRRLSPEQLEYLEKSFHEETKLDPERKLLLARQVGLQPRQVAVWFQNRRARWKAKHLERLYASLKQDYDAVYQEKQKLQDEVVRLKALLMGNGSSQCSVKGKDEEMHDSMVIQCSNSVRNQSHDNSTLQATKNNYLLKSNEYGNWCTFSRNI